MLSAVCALQVDTNTAALLHQLPSDTKVSGAARCRLVPGGERCSVYRPK